MWTYQRARPWARPGEKWVLIDRIYFWPGESPNRTVEEA